MIERFKVAAGQIVGFIRNPSEHLAKDQSDTLALRDIVVVTILITFPPLLFQQGSDPLVLGISLVLMVLLVWPLSWLLLNFTAYIFQYFLDWICHLKILVFQTELLKTQRIIAYTNLTILIGVIPIPYIEYISDVIWLVLTGVAINSLYGLKISHGIGVALAFYLIMKMLIYGVTSLIGLLA